MENKTEIHVFTAKGTKLFKIQGTSIAYSDGSVIIHNDEKVAAIIPPSMIVIIGDFKWVDKED